MAPTASAGQSPARAALLLAALLPARGFDMNDMNPVGHDDEPDSYCTPQLLGRYPGGWPTTLDTGIYWFGHGDVTQKATSGGASPFFDPARKTVIYFHGWTGNDDGWTKACKRDTLRCPSDVCREGAHSLLGEQWLRDGWNVGFYYWDQFADEDCTRDAEQKIWFDRHGDGFRWKSFDVGSGESSYRTYDGPHASMAELCADTIGSVLGQFSGEQVRFVGHNIGAQLATRCAAMLHSRGHRAAPQRLALLEPYFSKHHLWIFRCHDISTDSGLGDFTAKAIAVYVRSLWDQYKVVTEVYKSSVMTEHQAFGEPNEELEQASALVEYQVDWCGGIGSTFGSAFGGAFRKIDVAHLNCRHMAVFPMYFLGYGRPSPPVVPAQPMSGSLQPHSALSTCTTPSAGCTDGQIRQWVERQIAVEGLQKWVQATGSHSITTSDDAFELTPSLEEVARVDPGEAANLLVMQDALSVDDIFLEQHPTPWWLDPHSGKLQMLGVIASMGCLGIVGAAVFACRSGPGAGSDDDSGSEAGERSLMPSEDSEAPPKGSTPRGARRGAQWPQGRRDPGALELQESGA